MTDEELMRLALAQAEKAAALGRRPGGQQGTQPNGHQPPLHQRGK